MSDAIANLNAELAAYRSYELTEFVQSVSILLESADDGTLAYCAAHARIQTTLVRAVEKRLRAETRAGCTATVIPFPSARK